MTRTLRLKQTAALAVAVSGVVAAGVSPVGAAEAPVSVISVGNPSAEIVPISEISTLSAYGCDDAVCISLTGEGLTVDRWAVSAEVLSPGDCTFGVFYAPANTIAFYGPDLCNNTTEPGVYYAYYDDVVFSGEVQVCNTAVGFNGKPCKNIEA